MITFILVGLHSPCQNKTLENKAREWNVAGTGMRNSAPQHCHDVYTCAAARLQPLRPCVPAQQFAKGS